MINLKCPSCGLVNFANATTCKRCGQVLPLNYGSKEYSQAKFALKTKSELAGESSKSGGMSTKAQLKLMIPVLLVTPIFIVTMQRSSRPPKPGGYADLLDMSILVFCMLGILIYLGVMFMTRKKDK
jgi:hypothetical protein